MSKRNYQTFERGLSDEEPNMYDAPVNVGCSFNKRSRQNVHDGDHTTSLIARNNRMTKDPGEYISNVAVAEEAFMRELCHLNNRFLEFITGCIKEDNSCLAFTTFNEYMEFFVQLMTRYLSKHPESEITRFCMKTFQAYVSLKPSKFGLKLPYAHDASTNTDFTDDLSNDSSSDLSPSFPSKLRHLEPPSFSPTLLNVSSSQRVTWNRRKEIINEMRRLIDQPLSYSIPKKPPLSKPVEERTFKSINHVSKHFDFGCSDSHLKEAVENPSRINDLFPLSSSSKTASSSPVRSLGGYRRFFNVRNALDRYVLNFPEKVRRRSPLRSRTSNALSELLWTCDSCKEMNHHKDVMCRTCATLRDSPKKINEEREKSRNDSPSVQSSVPSITFDKPALNLQNLRTVSTSQNTSQNESTAKNNNAAADSSYNNNSELSVESRTENVASKGFTFHFPTKSPVITSTNAKTGPLKFSFTENIRNEQSNNAEDRFVKPQISFSFTSNEASNDSWKCPTCLVENKKTDLKCPCCETLKPSSSVQSLTSSKDSKSLDNNAETWICKHCLALNNGSDALVCAKCEGERNREVNASADLRSLSGSSGFSFSFANLTNSKKLHDSGAAVAATSESQSAHDGTSLTSKPLTFQFNLPKSTTASLSKLNSSSTTSNEVINEGEEENYEPPEAVTIEHIESGATLYKNCKLYYLDENSKYKLKSTGIINVILKDSKPSLLFRANDACGTVILSVKIVKEMKPTQKEKNVTIFSIAYPKFFENQELYKPMILLFKFKSVNDAEEFLHAIEQNV